MLSLDERISIESIQCISPKSSAIERLIAVDVVFVASQQVHVAPTVLPLTLKHKYFST